METNNKQVIIMEEALSYEERCERVTMMWLDVFNNGCMTEEKTLELNKDLDKYGVEIWDFWKCIDRHTYAKHSYLK
jgi:hypothetical protein